MSARTRFDQLLKIMATVPVSVVEGTQAEAYPASDAERDADFNARHHALMRGETDESLAKRIGLNVREWRDKFLHPDTLAIDVLSDIFYACECDPVMTLREARPPEMTPSGTLPASADAEKTKAHERQTRSEQ